VNELPATVTGADRAFLDRLVGRIQPDDRMNALFLGGSHAGGTADRYSDLDLTLVTTDAGWKAVLAERRQLLKSVGDIVFLEEHDDFGFLLLLFIYADGVRGELSLTPARDLESVLGSPNTTVFDKVGLLDGLEPPRLNDETRRGLVRRSLVWFWYERGLLDVFLARGSLWTAHFYLERCRERCLNLASLLDRPDLWPGGHEKAEVLLSSETTERLVPTVVPLEPTAMSEAAKLVTDVYMDLGRQLAELTGEEFPTRLAESVGERLRR
jgi:hypothetical protein